MKRCGVVGLVPWEESFPAGQGIFDRPTKQKKDYELNPTYIGTNYSHPPKEETGPVDCGAQSLFH